MPPSHAQKRPPRPALASPPPALTTPATPLPPAPACKNCRWWFSKSETLGQCRALPPSVSNPSQVTPYGPLGLFLVTPSDLYCGAHAPRA